MRRLLAEALLLVAVSGSLGAQNLKLHYTFHNVSADGTQVLDDSGGGYAGTLLNGAGVVEMDTFRVLKLGNANGYLDFGQDFGNVVAQLNDFSVSTYLFISTSTVLTNDGQFVWTFGNSNNILADKNGCMFFSAKTTRYSITQTDWSAKTDVNYGTAFPKGEWKHVVYTQAGNTGTLYIDGTAIKTVTYVQLKPSKLGATTCNYIGRSSYAADYYLKNSFLYDFRVYDAALSAGEVTALSANKAALDAAMTAMQLNEAAGTLFPGGLENLKGNILLTVSGNYGCTIAWQSANTGVVATDGTVTRPAYGQDTALVELTAVLSLNGQSLTKKFSASVVPFFDDRRSVATDSTVLFLNGNLNNLRADLKLPLLGNEGTAISWQTDNAAYIDATGHLVQLAAKGTGKQKVTLTATVTKGNEWAQKAFEVNVAEDDGFYGYLFAYFTSSSEAIYFALSTDGYKFRQLNNGSPVLSSAVISSTGGIRDPHVYRGPDGKFYMVATDLNTFTMGYTNYAMVLMKSDNLVDWTSSVVNIPAAFPEKFSTANRVWAPQTIYDEKAGKLMIYWSTRLGVSADPYYIDRLYYSYANADFTALETEPQPLFTSAANSAYIDPDIVYMDGQYHLFCKKEGLWWITEVTSNVLTGGYTVPETEPRFNYYSGEGSTVYRRINSDTCVFMYDGLSRYRFTETTDFNLFRFADSKMSMDFLPRHGCIMPITYGEARQLQSKWGYVTAVETPAAHVALSVFPNPASVTVRITCPGAKGGVVELFDGQGRKVLTETVTGEAADINVSPLLPGLYLAVYTVNGKLVGTGRLMVR